MEVAARLVSHINQGFGLEIGLIAPISHSLLGFSETQSHFDFHIRAEMSLRIGGRVHPRGEIMGSRLPISLIVIVPDLIQALSQSEVKGVVDLCQLSWKSLLNLNGRGVLTGMKVYAFLKSSHAEQI